MNLIKVLLLVMLTYTLGLTITGCKKDSVKQASNPTIVSTKPATDISATSVVSGGELLNATNITDRGLIWGTDSNLLTITNFNKISNGAGSSNYTDTIQTLQPSTTY